MPFRQDTMIFSINLIHRYLEMKCCSLETLSFAQDNHMSVAIIIHFFVLFEALRHGQQLLSHFGRLPVFYKY